VRQVGEVLTSLTHCDVKGKTSIIYRVHVLFSQCSGSFIGMIRQSIRLLVPVERSVNGTRALCRFLIARVRRRRCQVKHTHQSRAEKRRYNSRCSGEEAWKSEKLMEHVVAVAVV